MTKTLKTLIAATIATASFGAFAGELYDPTAGQPSATVSQTGVMASDARYMISANNQIGLEANDNFAPAPATTSMAALSNEMRADLYGNS